MTAMGVTMDTEADGEIKTGMITRDKIETTAGDRKQLNAHSYLLVIEKR